MQSNQNGDFCPSYGLGRKALIVYLSFLSAFTPLSTDLFLPALPVMSEYFGSSPAVTNLTLMGFMAFFAVSMIVWGPLSDKYGRKPIVVTGIALYLASSVLCSLAPDIWTLIAGRVVQAVGSGAVCAVALAIAKDVFWGRTMAAVLTTIQTMTMIAPMVAPVIGGAVLAVASWRAIFWVFVLFGIVAAAGTIPLGESLKNPLQGSALGSLGRIGAVLGNGRFSALLAVFSFAAMPTMAYLAASSYVFQKTFGLSPQGYSLFFCVNAVASVLGPALYPRFLSRVPQNAFLRTTFATIAAGGLLLLLLGHAGPVVFTLLMLPVTFLTTAMRPPSTIIMMGCFRGDSGTVASLIGSSGVAAGCLAMLGVGFWSDPVMATASVCLLAGVTSVAGWLLIEGTGGAATRGAGEEL